MRWQMVDLHWHSSVLFCLSSCCRLLPGLQRVQALLQLELRGGELALACLLPILLLLLLLLLLQLQLQLRSQQQQAQAQAQVQQAQQQLCCPQRLCSKPSPRYSLTPTAAHTCPCTW